MVQYGYSHMASASQFLLAAEMASAPDCVDLRDACVLANEIEKRQRLCSAKLEVNGPM
jgi:hypothetical protein